MGDPAFMNGHFIVVDSEWNLYLLHLYISALIVATHLPVIRCITLDELDENDPISTIDVVPSSAKESLVFIKLHM